MKALVGVLFLFSFQSAYAQSALKPRTYSLQTSIPAITGFSFKSVDEYRLGDEYGKRAVVASDLQRETPVFQRAAKATAKVGGATGFYLGLYKGQHVVATNHHVIESASACPGTRVEFTLLGVRTSCQQVLATWPSVDLTLFLIPAPAPADAAKLAAVAQNFSFDYVFKQDTKLLTVGFGFMNNPRSQMMANQDADCKVFSREGDYRLMADPDDFNPASYKTWSFATGCDVSHGDSGSAMIDRTTGQTVGIIWTGKFPKKPEVLSSAYLDAMMRSYSPEIWTELNYAVPASKMRDAIEDAMRDGQLPAATREIFAELLK